MVKVRSILIIWCYLLPSSNVNAKDPEHQKNESEPHTSGTGDNEYRYAFSHSAPVLCVSLYSAELLDERVQQREESQRTERTKTDQGESPEWP